MQVAMKAYDNPSCRSLQEFQDDLDRLSAIKKHVKRYVFTKNIKERLLLNHIIIFCNVFTREMGMRMLFSKMSEDMYPVLKTFFVFLDYMDDSTKIPECRQRLTDIPIDENLSIILYNIKEPD